MKASYEDSHKCFLEFDESFFCTCSDGIVFEYFRDKTFFVSSRMRQFPRDVHVGVELFLEATRIQGSAKDVPSKRIILGCLLLFWEIVYSI